MLEFFSILYIRPVDANILTYYCVRVANKRFNNLEIGASKVKAKKCKQCNSDCGRQRGDRR